MSAPGPPNDIGATIDITAYFRRTGVCGSMSLDWGPSEFPMVTDLEREYAVLAIGELLPSGNWGLVPDGARLCGQRADAFVRIDPEEHTRRAAAGLGAITHLGALDAMMNCPLQQRIPIAELSESELWALRRVPRGGVEWHERWVMRQCRPVAEVAAVVAWGSQLIPMVKRLGVFGAACSRVAVLDRLPKDFDAVAWRATVSGTGVWLSDRNGAVELIAAEPKVPRYFKAARWRFQEYAYQGWLATPDGARSTNWDSHGGSMTAESDRSSLATCPAGTSTDGA